MNVPDDLLNAIWPIMLADEGLRLKPYRDTKGLWTIGIGHLIGASIEDLELSRDVVNQIFLEDMGYHWKETCEIFGEQWLRSQALARQVALLSLVFNLGRTKLSKFIHTLPAIKEGRWNDAADLLLSTKWARDVDPKQREGEGRDDRIANMLREGTFDAYYKLGEVRIANNLPGGDCVLGKDITT